MAEVRYFTSRSYAWVVEGDITACFDEIARPARMDRVRERIGDKRVLTLVKVFLKAGILGEDRMLRDNRAGNPQGSIPSPLLSNVVLTVLDEHIAQGLGGPASSQTERAKLRRHCLANYRLVRCADDWCLMVSGTNDDAEALREEMADVLSGTVLRLSPVEPGAHPTRQPGRQPAPAHEIPPPASTEPSSANRRGLMNGRG